MIEQDKGVEVKYVVTYGPKLKRRRKEVQFDNIKLAEQYFKEKEKDYHVDVYKKITRVTVEKLTK